MIREGRDSFHFSDFTVSLERSSHIAGHYTNYVKNLDS